MVLLRSIKADLYKLRHTLILWIHILIPIIGAVAFLSYYSISGWKASTKVSAYFEALAASFPLLIGLICSMVVSQEEQTGNFQQLLTGSKWRGTALLSKLILLLLGALLSIAIALAVFGIGFGYVLKQKNLSLNCYIQVGAGLLLGNILLYIIHMYLSLKAGKGASISLGIAGSLISAIMLTGLGDRVWKIIPWGFGVRLCDYAVLRQINLAFYNMLKGEIQTGIIVITSMTIIALIGILVWFSSWEGRKSLE